MVIEQQKSTEIVLSKESLYDRNVVIAMRKLLPEQDFSIWPFRSRDISVRLWNLTEIIH